MYRTVAEVRGSNLGKLHPQEIDLTDLSNKEVQELYYWAGLLSIGHVEALVMQAERQQALM